MISGETGGPQSSDVALALRGKAELETVLLMAAGSFQTAS